jgi:hypothetical protein
MTRAYHHHVVKADLFEIKANARREAIKKVIIQRNPNASSEWVEKECSADHYFKAHVAAQQFHVRQATMYGLGAILEALSSEG